MLPHSILDKRIRDNVDVAKTEQDYLNLNLKITNR